MTASIFSFGSRATRTSAPLTGRSPVVRDTVVPGDRYAGHELFLRAADWAGDWQDVVFVTATRDESGWIRLGVLGFDVNGFGHFRGQVVAELGELASEVTHLLRSAPTVVRIASDVEACGEMLATLGCEVVGSRSSQIVRLFERGVLGIVRDDALDAQAARRAPEAVSHDDLCAATRAVRPLLHDLCALVAMGGDTVRVH